MILPLSRILGEPPLYRNAIPQETAKKSSTPFDNDDICVMFDCPKIPNHNFYWSTAMNIRNNRTVTNGPWGVSTSSGYGIAGSKLSVCRLLDGKLFADGRFRFLRGQLDGMMFADKFGDDYQRICLTYGYLKMYGRNTCNFVMSRAARKRGYRTTDGMYLRAQALAGK